MSRKTVNLRKRLKQATRAERQFFVLFPGNLSERKREIWTRILEKGGKK